MIGHFAILLVALLADRFWRGQHLVWQRYPHPVVLFGKLIDHAEELLRKPRGTRQQNRTNGAVALIVMLGIALSIGWLVVVVTGIIPLVGAAVEIVIVTVMLSQRSLADHVEAVAAGLRHDGLSGGRRAVGKIVGRDPEQLDESGVARSAIESLAENTSDGIVAPAFWYLVLGLPGILAYKMLNTADSMIGHFNDRYVDFGRAAAKADDLANWIPARLTGFLIALAAWSVGGKDRASNALKTMARDARLHRSPNAGWPEAAFAGALGIRLSGPRSYGGSVANEPVVNAAGRPVSGAADVDSALALFWRTCTMLAVCVGAMGLL